MTTGENIAERWLSSKATQADMIDTAIADAVKQEREECALMFEGIYASDVIQSMLRSRNDPTKLCPICGALRPQ